MKILVYHTNPTNPEVVDANIGEEHAQKYLLNIRSEFFKATKKEPFAVVVKNQDSIPIARYLSSEAATYEAAMHAGIPQIRDGNWYVDGKRIAKRFEVTQNTAELMGLEHIFIGDGASVEDFVSSQQKRSINEREKYNQRHSI